VIDIVDLRLGIDQLDEVTGDGDDVDLGEDFGILGDFKTELLVDPVAADISEVVALVGEEKLVDDSACGLLIRRFRVTQLAVFCAVIGMFLAVPGLPDWRLLISATIGIWLLIWVTTLGWWVICFPALSRTVCRLTCATQSILSPTTASRSLRLLCVIMTSV